MIYSILLGYLVLTLAFFRAIEKNMSFKSFDKNYIMYKLPYSFYFIVFLPLIIIAGIRYNVGTDYSVYLNNQIPSVVYGVENSVEPLFQYVIKIAAFFGNYQLVFVITHFLIVYFLTKGIHQQSNNVLLSILVLFGSGFYNYSLNIMRQAIAISIFLYGYKYINKDKYRYFGSVIIASLFHKAAILYIVFYFFKNVKVNSMKSLGWILIVYIFKNSIRKILIYISITFNFYPQYFNSILDFGKNSWTFLIVNLSIYILYLSIYNNTSLVIDELKMNQFLLVQFVTTMICVLAPILPNYERLMYMFMILQVLSIPCYIKSIESKVLKAITIAFLCFMYLLLFYRLFIIANIGETFPYQTIY